MIARQAHPSSTQSARGVHVFDGLEFGTASIHLYQIRVYPSSAIRDTGAPVCLIVPDVRTFRRRATRAQTNRVIALQKLYVELER